jgi:hypothetical protein
MASFIGRALNITALIREAVSAAYRGNEQLTKGRFFLSSANEKLSHLVPHVYELQALPVGTYLKYRSFLNTNF